MGIVIGTYCSVAKRNTYIYPKNIPGYIAPDPQILTEDEQRFTFKYTPIEYNISYELNGGTIDPSITLKDKYTVEEEYFDVYQIIIFGLSSIGIFFISKECNLQKALLPIIFLGGFLFHIMWETKAIYVIQYYYILLPFSAYGLYKLSKIVLKKFKLE